MYQMMFEIGYTRCAFKETILQEGEKIIGVRARVLSNWPSKYFDFEFVIAKSPDRVPNPENLASNSVSISIPTIVFDFVGMMVLLNYQIMTT